jgi:hypothetical protein
VSRCFWSAGLSNRPVPSAWAQVCRSSRVEIMAPAVQQHDILAVVLTSVSRPPATEYPCTWGLGMAMVVGKMVCVKPSGWRILVRSTS